MSDKFDFSQFEEASAEDFDFSQFEEAPAEEQEKFMLPGKEKGFVEDKILEPITAAMFKTAESGSLGLSNQLLGRLRGEGGVDEIRDISQKIEDEEPVASMVGTALGFIPGTLVKGGKLAVGAANTAIGTVREAARQKLGMDNEFGKGDAAVDATLGAATELLPPALKFGTKASGKAFRRLVASAQGVPTDVIDTYLKRPEVIDSTIEALDNQTFLSDAAMEVNNNIKEFITGKVQKVNGLLKEADEKVLKGEVDFSVDPILEAADEVSQNLTQFGADKGSSRAAKRINELSGRLREMDASLESGITPSQLNKVKKDLYTEIDSFYRKNNIKRDTYGENLASVVSKAKNILDEVAPDIRTQNQALGQLSEAGRKLGFKDSFKKDNVINGILQDGALDENGMRLLLNKVSSLAGKTQKSAAELVDNLTDTNLIEKAEDFKAGKSLSNSDLFSRFNTGKGAAIIGTGAVGGALSGQEDGAKLGAGLALILQSPKALRPMLKGNAFGRKMVEKIGENPRILEAIRGGVISGNNIDPTNVEKMIDRMIMKKKDTHFIEAPLSATHFEETMKDPKLREKQRDG